VHPLGKGLGQAVCERLQQDRAVVVQVGLELDDLVVAAESCGDRERPDVVGDASVLRRDEVAERAVRDALAVLALLAQVAQRDTDVAP
jgi:hypothetical protein